MAATRQYCTFLLDGLLFGIEVEKVQEVIRHQPVTRVPLASPIVRGLINLRGRIVTALDLRQRLHMAPRSTERLPMNVVVRNVDGEVSLLVDDIGDVLEVDQTAFALPPETLQGVGRELIRGVYKVPGLLIVLDLERTVHMETGN